MSVNKYQPHVLLILEDDANRQLALGFLDHYAVADTRVGMRAPAGGWSKVLDVFGEEYVQHLRTYRDAHVVMVIDFDESEGRRAHFEGRVPDDVRSRVFVVGSKVNPETLKCELGMSPERIGWALAEDCCKNHLELWHHAHLLHNSAELERMVPILKPILFQGN